jgi:hypothetical protein
MRQRLIKRLEEIKPSPGEAKALVDRMKNGTFSELDRQRVMEMLEAEQEVLECLAAWHPPAPPSPRHRTAKRKRQMVKGSRRHNRR